MKRLHVLLLLAAAQLLACGCRDSGPGSGAENADSGVLNEGDCLGRYFIS